MNSQIQPYEDRQGTKLRYTNLQFALLTLPQIGTTAQNSVVGDKC
jgi:hypothetical protein